MDVNHIKTTNHRLLVDAKTIYSYVYQVIDGDFIRIVEINRGDGEKTVDVIESSIENDLTDCARENWEISGGVGSNDLLSIAFYSEYFDYKERYNIKLYCSKRGEYKLQKASAVSAVKQSIQFLFHTGCVSKTKRWVAPVKSHPSF